MRTALKLMVGALSLILLLGMTVNPPKDMERQVDDGGGLLSPVPEQVLPVVETPNPQPQSSPTQITPSPQFTAQPSPALTQKSPAPAGEIPLKQLLIVTGIVILLLLLGFFIYQKSVPKF